MRLVTDICSRKVRCDLCKSEIQKGEEHIHIIAFQSQMRFHASCLISYCEVVARENNKK